MLSKLKLAFSASSSSSNSAASPSTLSPSVSNNDTTTFNNKRTRSSTVPSASPSLANSRPVRGDTAPPPPLPPAPVDTTARHIITSSPAGASSSSSSTASIASSSYTITPLPTPHSSHFPIAPFSTPATPPRAAMTSNTSPISYMSVNDNSRSPHQHHHQQHPQQQQYLHPQSPHHHHQQVPHQTQTHAHRKKTKSTATLPNWLISSFSSSTASLPLSPSPSTSSSPASASSSGRVPTVTFPLRVEARRGSLPLSSPSSAGLSVEQSSHPSTPVRHDRPPLKVPSPLSTSTSPLQEKQDADAPVPVVTKATRRKSILSGRRKQTQTALKEAFSLSSSVRGVASPSSHASKSNSTQQHRSVSGSGSGDYSSLLSASKRVFSKSVDDLTSFTKQSLLSSPINYSRPRKSVDERRVYHLPHHQQYSMDPASSASIYASSSPYSAFEFRDTQREDVDADADAAAEELESLSSSSSTSLAHSTHLSHRNHRHPQYSSSDDSSSSPPVPALSPDYKHQHQQQQQHPAHSHHHHIFRVPKLPTFISPSASSSSNNKHFKSKSSHSNPTGGAKSSSSHKKSASSAQVLLPPSSSLPAGLCIESTASILASSLDANTNATAAGRHQFVDLSHIRRVSSSTTNSKKRKSVDLDTVSSAPAGAAGVNALVLDGNGRRSVSGSDAMSTTTMRQTSLAPPLTLSPPMRNTKDLPSTNASPISVRPPLTSRKSSGNGSIASSRSISTARMPSFGGSPKPSPSPSSSSDRGFNTGTPPSDSKTQSTANTAAAPRQRSSQIILIEGLLQRKTDHRSHVKTSSWSFPFTHSSSGGVGGIFSSSSSCHQQNSTSTFSSSPKNDSPFSRQRPSVNRTNSEPHIREVDLSKGWKPFYAILRGTNLYLYKIPGDMNLQARACFASYTSASRPSGSNNLSASTSRGGGGGGMTTFTASASSNSTANLDEGKLKASISNQAKAVYLLPIANSTVRPIQSATQGDVFELLTEDGEVAILQTSNSQETAQWMSILSSMGTSIANKRASYLENMTSTFGKLDTTSTTHPVETIQERNSESWERSAGQNQPPPNKQRKREKMFGVPLEVLIEREGAVKIPKIIHSLLQEVENRGLLETGIYRVPGETRVLQAMKAKFDGGFEIDFSADSQYSDPHNLASLTKLWLRELPEIISPRFYSSFIEANNIEGYEERLCAIRDLVWQLPTSSFNLLDRLCEHLHLIAEHELENQMHASNLAIVFAPTILRPPEGSDSYALLMTNLGRAAKLVSSLIVQHHWIFSGEEVEDDADVTTVIASQSEQAETDLHDKSVDSRAEDAPSGQETNDGTDNFMIFTSAPSSPEKVKENIAEPVS